MHNNIFLERDFDKFISLLFCDNRILFHYYYALLVKVRKGNKFYTIGDKQLSIIFVDIKDPLLLEIFNTIIDRLEILFEEYPTELEYTCDALLLEFHPAHEVDKRFKISNLSEAKAKLDSKSMSRGISVFNVLGGFDIRKVATQIDLKKRYYSTTVERLSGFRTDNPLLLEFKEKFNAELLKASPLKKSDYEFLDTSEVFKRFIQGKERIIIVDVKDGEVHKRLYNMSAKLLLHIIDISNGDGT